MECQFTSIFWASCSPFHFFLPCFPCLPTKASTPPVLPVVALTPPFLPPGSYPASSPYLVLPFLDKSQVALYPASSPVLPFLFLSKSRTASTPPFLPPPFPPLHGAAGCRNLGCCLPLLSQPAAALLLPRLCSPSWCKKVFKVILENGYFTVRVAVQHLFLG